MYIYIYIYIYITYKKWCSKRSSQRSIDKSTRTQLIKRAFYRHQIDDMPLNGVFKALKEGLLLIKAQELN